MAAVTLFLAGLVVFLVVLLALGIVADSWDSRERRDAERRNHVSRRR